MSIETIVTTIVGLMIGLIVAFVAFRKLPKKLKPNNFVKDWRLLQAYCKDKNTWGDALVAADKLLDKALKKRRFKGKSMGERMVAAQHKFRNNDDIWFAHNLTKKVKNRGDKMRLKESEVKEALICFRHALTDLGALPNADKKDS